MFEDFDFTRVGYYQSVLEANGVATTLKNQYASSGVGEIPFLEAIPQVWILYKRDLAKAKQVIDELEKSRGQNQGFKDWECSHCGAEVEGSFAVCWQCGKADEPDS